MSFLSHKCNRKLAHFHHCTSGTGDCVTCVCDCVCDCVRDCVRVCVVTFNFQLFERFLRVSAPTVTKWMESNSRNQKKPVVAIPLVGVHTLECRAGVSLACGHVLVNVCEMFEAKTGNNCSLTCISLRPSLISLSLSLHISLCLSLSVFLSPLFVSVNGRKFSGEGGCSIMWLHIPQKTTILDKMPLLWCSSHILGLITSKFFACLSL